MPASRLPASRLLFHVASHAFVAALALAAWRAVAVHPVAGLVGAALAVAVAIVAALVASLVLHEWGHFAGALLSASKLTLKSKLSPLFFDFDYMNNTPRQYLWLGIGGLLGNIVLIAGTLALLPMPGIAPRWLLATELGQLVYVLVLEWPVNLGILQGGQPLAVLGRHFGQGKPLFRRALLAGVASGIAIALFLSR